MALVIDCKSHRQIVNHYLIVFAFGKAVYSSFADTRSGCSDPAALILTETKTSRFKSQQHLMNMPKFKKTKKLPETEQ